MNILQIEKLKSLIKLSSILNAQEREEWLQLLELMNDKQMLELEKVLEGGKQTAPTLRSEQAVSSRQTFASPLFSKDERETVHAPSLAHIINLPKTKISQSLFPFSHLEGTKISPSSGSATKLPGSIVGEEKTKSKFWQKIKDILAEKELPAGHPEAIKELELPSPSSKYQAPKPSRSYDWQANIKDRKPISAQKLRVPVPQAIKPKPASPTEITAKLAKAVLAKKSQVQEGFKPALPIKVEKDREKEEVRISNLSERELVRGEESEVETPLKLEEVSDLAQINPGDFNVHTFNSLTKKIKALISKFDYHQVMANLEKSLLFKAYINTGTQILNQKGDFMRLASKSPREFLNRENFEKFTDLLMKIQT